MSMLGCYSLTNHATSALNSEAGRSAVRELITQGASREAIVSAFAAGAPDDIAQLIRYEFSEMPDPMFQTILTSWLAADGSGKSFELRSVQPEKPLEYAHKGRVRLTVDYEEDRAVVSVSHVAGRHADWYKPAEALA